MSLRKKSKTTEASIAASQANGRRSHGPATPEGRERIRAARTRHGFYSQAEAMALTCLGEDPADLERLRRNLHNNLQPPSPLEEELAEHLAQVVWRWRRASRMQEGFALRLAKNANLTRDDRLHAQMMRLKITAETLRRLAQSVAREEYITPREDLEIVKNLHQEGAVKEIGEVALALFYQLQKPGTDETGMDPDEQSRRALAKFKAIFGLHDEGPSPMNVAPASGFSPEGPYVRPQEGFDLEQQAPEIREVPATRADAGLASSLPPVRQEGAGATGAMTKGPRSRFTSAEWEARERPRQLLENILRRQVELCETQRKAILKESLAGPSPFERAAEVGLAHPNVALMQRMEESSFRQIWRITNLLLKLKRQAREEGSGEMPVRTWNTTENTDS